MQLGERVRFQGIVNNRKGSIPLSVTNIMNDSFGYPSNEPCVVCGKRDNNQSEPRFGYTVCEKHQGIKPSEINGFTKKTNDSKGGTPSKDS